jgi:hypothetical protein
MRKILLLTLLFICFKASAQQTYWTPGVPPSSTSFVPSFRYIGTDSLAKFYIANGNRYSQIYTAAQVNALIGSSGVTTGILNGLSLTASGTTAHVATGQYAINGTTYTIGSIVTQTIPAQNDSLSRYVVFYGTTSGVIDTALGILGTDAVYPNVRNNTAQIGSVLITPTSVTAGGVTGVYALLHGNNNLSGGFTGINAFYGPTNWHGNQKFYKLPSIITSGTALVLGADSVVHLISPTADAASASASSDFTAQTTAGTITSVTSADLTAQTTAGTITSVTSAAATSTYNVGAYLNVTAVTTDVIEVQIIFTDENNTAQTITLPTVSTTGYVSMTPQIIRVKASTTITVKTTLTTGVGSSTFDTGAYITKSY